MKSGSIGKRKKETPKSISCRATQAIALGYRLCIQENLETHLLFATSSSNTNCFICFHLLLSIFEFSNSNLKMKMFD
ncbi:hypothetical protein T4B_3935 [Trichinella pseudospiralis]|uniref:Uncharacterized protein n=1 Tax=Trichinella pseudospiralis TaxID=6337 RepID=A0A0V1IMP4_TRIPS|nr:hypothetical protein T4B_3935 [Trichinella pseudospiralis]